MTQSLHNRVWKFSRLGCLEANHGNAGFGIGFRHGHPIGCVGVDHFAITMIKLTDYL
jgi:hypothetical protein